MVRFLCLPLSRVFQMDGIVLLSRIGMGMQTLWATLAYAREAVEVNAGSHVSRALRAITERKVTGVGGFNRQYLLPLP